MDKQGVYDLLKSRRIEYEVTEHVPVFTIEEMLDANLPYPEIIAKNLFIRDDKKHSYYLITVNEERKINLKEFQEEFGTRKLSFASENDLMSIMGLIRGAVTPFGLLNDSEKKVQFFIGKELMGGRLGIHPNDNTATVWIKTIDLLKIIEEHGNSITIM